MKPSPSPLEGKGFHKITARGLFRLLIPVLTIMLMAAASDPSERLADPKAEAQARALFQEIRCVVCQNESIDDSAADIAKDLRGLVREKVAAGEAPAQIKRELVQRYGEFILLKPVFSWGNAVLWLAPFVLVLAAGAALIWRGRRQACSAPAPLSAEEETALLALHASAEALISTQSRRKADAEVSEA